MATVTVKPYVDREEDKIGLAGLGLNAFPGTKKIFQIPIKSGRFLTGFDEKAAYLSNLEPKEREKEIKRIKSECKEFAELYPHLPICDCAATNDYYRNMVIELGASNNYFDTNTLEDRIKLTIIRTGARWAGDSFVASNFEEAATSNKDYMYYISDPELDIETEVSLNKKRNKAIGALDKMEDDSSEMLLLAKYLFKPSKALNPLTKNGLYKKLDDFIKGIVDGEPSKEAKINHEIFIKATKIPKEEIITKVVIKYGIYQGVIRQRADKEYIYTKTGNELGKTPEEVYLFLSNLSNTDIFAKIKEDVDSELKIY